MVQRSEFCPAENCGAIAEGGGDLTVVVWLPLVVTVDVDSVTIGSAALTKLAKRTNKPPQNTEAENRVMRCKLVTSLVFY